MRGRATITSTTGRRSALDSLPDKLDHVSALLKIGKYITYSNYVYRTEREDMHTVPEHGVPWSAELERCLKDCSRSVTGGLGAAQQSLPLDPLLVPSLALGNEQIAVGGPAGPGATARARGLFAIGGLAMSELNTMPAAKAGNM